MIVCTIFNLIFNILINTVILGPILILGNENESSCIG